MGLYVIGDTHLSFGTNKEMDVFGGNWVGYMTKLQESLSSLTAEDTLVLAGDISWGMSLEQARKDFTFLGGLAPKIILLKGNHDYWWTTANKMNTFFAENGWDNLTLLHNNCHSYQGVSLCGTRGWFYEVDRGEHSAKVFNREMIRLETSLKEGENNPENQEKICFLHYPPLALGYRCEEIMTLLKKYQVTRCFFGHLHGKSHRTRVEGPVDGVDFRLVSADFLGFQPMKIL